MVRQPFGSLANLAYNQVDDTICMAKELFLLCKHCLVSILVLQVLKLHSSLLKMGVLSLMLLLNILSTIPIQGGQSRTLLNGGRRPSLRFSAVYVQLPGRGF